MKIEAVIICINYGDFLSHTLPYNKGMFDRMVVVTDTKDTETKKVCEKWNVMCVQTDAFYEDGPVPNKAKGINVGLQNLYRSGWVVQLDADIWLPPFFRNFMEQMPLDETCVYSMDRLMCNSYKDWYKFTHVSKKSLHEGWTFLRMDTMEVGSRLVHHSEGYLPIGYFQLWHPKTSGIHDYPVEIHGYDRTDVVHIKRWTRDKRRFIPDIVCVHLASESHKQGQNWRGRTTVKFGHMNVCWLCWLHLKIFFILLWKAIERWLYPKPPPYVTI